MWQDILYGFRTMAKSPGVAAIAVLTLALGIGANTAMFSVVNAVLLRPLPYRDPDRLVTIRAQIPSMNITGAFVEYNTYGEWWRARSHSFESMAAFTPGSAILTAGGEPERLTVYRVSAGFLSMIGVRPVIGRDFAAGEDQPGAPRVAILSHGLWVRRFGGDPSLTGRPIQFDHNNYTVAGILPPGFGFYGDDIDVYTPIAASTARVQGMPSVGVHARLRPGVTVARAQAEIDALCRGWVDQYHYPNDWGARMMTIRGFMVRDVSSSVVALGVAVALVLLIACANVANLLLARGGSRLREMAIRGTLGASGYRIARQLLTESALLGLLGGGLGLFAAWGGANALAAASAGYLPLQKTVSIDATVLGFTLGAAVLTVLLFGLAPALSGARTVLAKNLNEGGRSGGEGLRRRRFSSALVIGEVALALLLAIGATLMAHSLVRLQAVNPGFNPDGVLTASLTLPAESYDTGPKQVGFFRSLVARLEAMPGVTAAGMVSHLPFSHSKTGSSVTVEGAPPPASGDRIIVFTRVIDPKYFPAMRVRLLKGRFFDQRDPTGGPVAIVNEALARRCWPNQDPVGKRFGFGAGAMFTVVGVIADMRETSLADQPDLEAFLPHAQIPGRAMSLVVRTGTDPMRLAPAVRAAVRELDKNLPLTNVRSLAEDVSHSTQGRRFTVALLSAFAVLALVLAAVGIYGVISYSVTRRTHEIGVRMALGAGRGRIVGMVVGRAALLGGAGVALGAAGGLALTRLLRSMLYGVSPTDPAAFTGASLFLLAVAAVAGYIPARRAARVDPGVALRHE